MVGGGLYERRFVWEKRVWREKRGRQCSSRQREGGREDTESEGKGGTALFLFASKTAAIPL